MLCAGLCAGVCAGQTETPSGAAAAGTETKNVVQGKVVQEPGGQGIRKVKVSLTGNSGQRVVQYEAITNDAGQFKVEGIEPGTYAVQLERSGYATEAKTNRGRTIEVIAGQDTKDLVFRMFVAGVIAGKIVDADGDPLRNVDVMAIPTTREATRRNLARPGSGATNDLGEYRIADLPPGRYMVHATPPENQAPLPSPSEKNATKERLVYVTTYFPGTLDEHQAAVVEVSAGGTAIANFVVRTGHAYRVSGTVMGVGGQAMAQLFLVGKSGEREHPQQLGEGGRFEFPSVLAGTYRALLITFSEWGNGRAPSVKVQSIRTPIEVRG